MAAPSNTTVPALAQEAVLVASEPMPEGAEKVCGHKFQMDKPVDYHALLQAFTTSGFQATNFGLAVKRINEMLELRGQPVPEDKIKPYLEEPGDRPINNCTIFLGYTSNQISSGCREVIRFLAQHNMVDVLVTSAGGIEEDLMKCLASMYLGDFTLSGAQLRKKGINRIGNLLVPNDAYCKFEDWLTPLLDTMKEEEKTKGVVWSPSKIIHRLGKEIDNEDSVYYWAYKNNIPVFCPAITDGALGDVLYFHSYKNPPGLVVDIVQDIRRINHQAVRAANSGMIILGGGVCKHHVCNANLMRNGADFSVFVSTAQEYDGSDSGASPDEAVSWGKIKGTAKPVKIHADATIVFPLLVAETFARNYKTPPPLTVNGLDSNLTEH